MPHQIDPERKFRSRAGQSTVYIQPAERTWLARLGQPLSAQMREDLETLQRLGRPPALSEQEWGLLRDALVSSVYSPSMARSLPLLLAATVEDSAPDGLADKWGVDLTALAERLRTLHPADAWAVWDQVRRWWAEQG